MGELQVLRKKETSRNGNKRSEDGTYQVEGEDFSETTVERGLAHGKGVHDQDEHEDGGDAFHGSHEQDPEFTDPFLSGEEYSEKGADCDRDGNTVVQLDAVVLRNQIFKHFIPSEKNIVKHSRKWHNCKKNDSVINKNVCLFRINVFYGQENVCYGIIAIYIACADVLCELRPRGFRGLVPS